MVYFIMSFLNRRDQPKNLPNSGTISRPSSNLFENATLMVNQKSNHNQSHVLPLLVKP